MFKLFAVSLGSWIHCPVPETIMLEAWMQLVFQSLDERPNDMVVSSRGRN
jgi:hypothetical protein